MLARDVARGDDGRVGVARITRRSNLITESLPSGSSSVACASPTQSIAINRSMSNRLALLTSA
jgi:hypothetical protein